MGRMLSSTPKPTEGPGHAPRTRHHQLLRRRRRGGGPLVRRVPGHGALLLGPRPRRRAGLPGAPHRRLRARTGFIDRRFAPKGATGEPGRAIALWHVDDLEATVAR